MSNSRHDLHDVLDDLRAEHALLEVDRQVERGWEIAAVLDRLERTGRYDPVLFRSALGHPGWSVLGNLFADRRIIAMLLGIDPTRLSEEFTQRLEHPIQPVMVDEAPVHAHVMTGEALLDLLPLPTLHEKDAAPYISMGIAICRDPDTGQQNAGIYRFMQRGPTELVPSLTSISNAADIFRRYERRNQAMEIAIVPGASPALALAASFRAAAGVDETALAGGLAQEPLRLVRARTVGLDVPADAEVVIEALVQPGGRYPEAPFADMSRSYSRVKHGPLVTVQAVTHRENPVLQLAFSGHAEASNMAALCHETAIWQAVRQATGCVRSVHVPANGYGFHCYLGVEKTPTVEGRERGEHRNAMLAVLGAVTQIKLVVAFDADVNIYDDNEVLGALARRFQAVDPLTGESRIQVIPNLRGATYDPSSFHREYPNSKLMIDATLSTDLTDEQRAGFESAVCAGSETIRLADYFPQLELGVSLSVPGARRPSRFMIRSGGRRELANTVI
jgi:2,5-furandicarboxylate decarboxylase 1